MHSLQIAVLAKMRLRGLVVKFLSKFAEIGLLACVLVFVLDLASFRAPFAGSGFFVKH